MKFYFIPSPGPIFHYVVSSRLLESQPIFFPIYLTSHPVSSHFISSHLISLIVSRHVSSHSYLILKASHSIISHHVSSNPPTSHHVSLCLIMSHRVSPGTIMSHHVSSCLIMFHPVSPGMIICHHFPQSSGFFSSVKNHYPIDSLHSFRSPPGALKWF